MKRGSFATGYEKITRKVWVCGLHGRVSAARVIPFHRLGGGIGHFHAGCGCNAWQETVPNQK